MSQVLESPTLTEDQLRLLSRLCMPQKLVCRELGIDIWALKARTRRLMAKFGVENQRALLVKALRLGLVDLDSIDYREF